MLLGSFRSAPSASAVSRPGGGGVFDELSSAINNDELACQAFDQHTLGWNHHGSPYDDRARKIRRMKPYRTSKTQAPVAAEFSLFEIELKMIVNPPLESLKEDETMKIPSLVIREISP